MDLACKLLSQKSPSLFQDVMLKTVPGFLLEKLDVI